MKVGGQWRTSFTASYLHVRHVQSHPRLQHMCLLTPSLWRSNAVLTSASDSQLFGIHQLLPVRQAFQLLWLNGKTRGDRRHDDGSLFMRICKLSSPLTCTWSNLHCGVESHSTVQLARQCWLGYRSATLQHAIQRPFRGGQNESKEHERVFSNWSRTRDKYMTPFGSRTVPGWSSWVELSCLVIFWKISTLYLTDGSAHSSLSASPSTLPNTHSPY